jgi:hypothetical protein
VISHSLSGNRNSRVREFNAHNIGSFTSPKPDGQRVNVFFLIGDFPYREITICDVNSLNLQSPMPDVPISDACVDLGLLPSKPSFPRTPVQLHLYSTNPRGPPQPRHLLLSCDRESRDRGFIGRNSFASQNPECRILTSRDLVPPVLVTSMAPIKSGNRDRDFDQHRTLYPENPDTPNTDGLFLPSCA